jgi:hypothetical protein
MRVQPSRNCINPSVSGDCRRKPTDKWVLRSSCYSLFFYKVFYWSTPYMHMERGSRAHSVVISRHSVFTIWPVEASPRGVNCFVFLGETVSRLWRNTSRRRHVRDPRNFPTINCLGSCYRFTLSWLLGQYVLFCLYSTYDWRWDGRYDDETGAW